MSFNVRRMGWFGLAFGLLLGGGNALADVRGRALLLDAPDRTRPGNLMICQIAGNERKTKVLVEGPVMDARFSPDGKQVVYGMHGMIRTLDLATGVSRDVIACTTNMTYFNWCSDSRIYWSDGEGLREIYRVNVAGGEKEMIHKGNSGRTTISLDGKKAAWVIPPMCAIVGGKQFRFQGGCGGAVSPSGKYLTSNLTTGHRLMGILEFGEDGPSEQPIAAAVARENHAINGFFFGRTDDWVCYVTEAPKDISPISFICHWKTDDHVEVAKKLCIRDFVDETDLLPPGAVLEKITVCEEGPFNVPLTNGVVNVGVSRSLKVVGHYRGPEGGAYTPRLREGISWKADGTRVGLSDSAVRGLGVTDRTTVTAEFGGRSHTFEVEVRPELAGAGFKAEFFGDAGFATNVLTRRDAWLDFRWEGNASPDPAVNGRKPWSARWTGEMDVQADGDYTFYFLQGEGNDWFSKGETDEKGLGYAVWLGGQPVIRRTGNWNGGWVHPTASAPITLKKGRHPIRVTTIDRSAHPVVVKLYWSGPGIKRSLLGGGHVHSGIQP